MEERSHRVEKRLRAVAGRVPANSMDRLAALRVLARAAEEEGDREVADAAWADLEEMEARAW